MLWELRQEMSIGEAGRQADRADSTASHTEGELELLSRRVEHLTLACQALWELQRQTSGLTDKQLRGKMQEIDLRDGKADGKIGRQVLSCKACGAKSNSRRTHCIMCGAALEKAHLFE